MSNPFGVPDEVEQIAMRYAVREAVDLEFPRAAGVIREAYLRAWMAGAIAEREACAKIAEGDTQRDDFPWCGDVREIAKAIRARSQS